MKSSSEIKKIAKNAIAIQIAEISSLEDRINNNFVKVINLILNSKGRLIVAGIGKSANIANKLVATLNSTGQPAVFLHAADAIHGDLGNVQQGEVVMCISKSGNTPEVKTLVSYVKDMGNKIIALTGNNDSFLAKESDLILDVSVKQEACPNNLAPTSSTTAQLVMGDTIAISLLACKDFTHKDFARFHPGGALGKRLSLRLIDILSKKSAPRVEECSTIHEVIIEISQNRLGATAVITNDQLHGIITDGDLRRMFEKENSFSNLLAKDIMCTNPKKMDLNSLAYDALQMMENNKINQVIVVNNEKYVGIVHIHQILKEGIL